MTVHLRRDVARSIRDSKQKCAEADALRSDLADFGVEIHPLHSDDADAELSTHFRIETSSTAEADTVVESLLQQPFVDAAYIKPLDQPPQ